MDKNRNTTAIIIGSVLLVIGILSLIGNIFNFLNMDSLWPFIIIGVGAAFFVAVALGDKSRSGLAVPGSILVMVGLILFFMNLTNSWESWAYCWALIICASGIGVWISGTRIERPELAKQGLDTLKTGLILFIIFAVIMEFIFTATGVHPKVNPIAWAILLCLVGLYLVVTRLLELREPGSKSIDLFWPILMIGVGVIAIFWQLKVIPADNLGRLLNLWPLLLIVAGAGIILRSRSPWTGAVLGLLVVAGILVVGFAGAQLGLSAQPVWLSDFVTIEFGDGPSQLVGGSGKLVTEDRPVSGVSRVELAIPADLEIQQGATEALTVTGDDNVLPLLMTVVSGDKLTIRYKPQVNVHTFSRPQLSLTVKDLSEVRVSSSGNIKVGSITTSDFKIELSSSGDINIQGLQAEDITAELSSSGNIIIQGNANALNLSISSSGSFQAGDLKVQKAVIRVSSSGDVTVWVVENLDANISSSGDIAYYGKPVVHQNLSSSGTLIPKGDK